MIRSSVLLVGNFLSSTGLNRGYSEEMADRMEARGWRVTRTSGLRNRALRLADMLRTTWRARDAYDVAHVDVFSGASFVWAEAVCFELRQLRKPYVLTLRGGNLPQFARRWPTRVRRLLGSAAAVTVPSGFLEEQMEAYRRDLVLIANAIEVSAYPFRHRGPASPTLAWVRAFHAVYNPRMAVDVLARVRKEHAAAHLMMLGPDKDGSRAEVEHRARELGVADQLLIVGQVPKRDIGAHLARADVFVNTTNIDNAPITVLEAMAAGLCVVSTNVGGVPYAVRDGDDGLLVPPNDPDAMSAAVERILGDPQLASQLSQRARERACRSDWSSVLPRWDELLAGVAHG